MTNALTLSRVFFVNYFPRSLLGGLWPVVLYLMLVAVKSFFFQGFFSSYIENYAIYLLFSLIAWGVVSTALGANFTRLSESKPLLVQRPGASLLLYLGYALCDLYIASIKFFIAILALLIFSSIGFSLRFILIAFLGVSLLVVFCNLLAYVVGIMVVRFRDISPVVRFSVGLMYFALPILYYEGFDGAPKIAFELNPFYYFVVLVRSPVIAPENLSGPFFLALVFVAIMATFALIVHRCFYRKYLVYL